VFIPKQGDQQNFEEGGSFQWDHTFIVMAVLDMRTFAHGLLLVVGTSTLTTDGSLTNMS
jgi:hypothetical protein